MKALLLPISFLVLAATAAACLDFTPYPLVEVPEEGTSCDGDGGDGGDPATCADAADEGTPEDAGGPDD